jgi:hypothetical protein
MFSENCGRQSVWLPSRLQSGRHGAEKNRSDSNIGTSIRSFSDSEIIFPPSLLVCGRGLVRGVATLAAAGILLSALYSAAAAPAYVQGNYAVPQTPQTTVIVPYTATQAAADLNVVIVGWNNTTAHISSVTDTAGNIYNLVVGPTQVSGTLSQSIFYAQNIAAAAAGKNAVTVTFSQAAAYPDIRILEYSGIDSLNPVDLSVGATGNNSESNSGAVTTTNATDLLVGANCVLTSTSGPGSGFKSRMITETDGDIAEDTVVSATGSYSATAPLGSPGPWVMQMVAFRAAGSSTAGPTPTPTPSPTPTPAPTPTPSPSPSRGLGYVQGNYAVPQTPQTRVTVPYTATQSAADLNVVVVGWNDTTAQVSSVTDTVGNTYNLAVGPTQVSGTLSQSIFYAKNVAAAAAHANAVTVTFSQAAAYPDIRILEYSGIDSTNPVDVFLGAAGNNSTSNSGAVTTTNATDLLVGANCVLALTSGPGSGFTSRMITEPDGDIAEDTVVSATGSYSATAPLGNSSPWVMQMVAFRAAGSSTAGPTPTPTPTPSPSPAPTPGQVSLGWNQDTDSSTVGYILYYTTSSGLLTSGGTVPTSGTVQSNYSGIGTTTATLANLNSGQTYYFGVAAYNASNQMSLLSNVVTAVAP